MLIFAEKKADVDDIHEYLLLKGVEAVAIHGGKGIYEQMRSAVNFCQLPSKAFESGFRGYGKSWKTHWICVKVIVMPGMVF